MGSDQSSLPAGVPGSSLRSQRDEEIPYTQYSISKPIDSYSSHSPRQSPRPQKTQRPVVKQEKDGTPKHEIIVVADGYSSEGS
uniref:Uncharacterized protein n=1 Tax=Arion vulgaris TaxID=1028688 RepID=A0A0B7ATC4_9EUPU